MKDNAVGNNIIRNQGRVGGDKRIYSLDKLKAICAFFVVCIHCPFGEPMGEYIKTAARVAVPLFFLISGFFCVAEDEEQWRKRIKKFLFLIVGANILFLIWRLFLSIYGGYTAKFVADLCSWKNWLIFIFLNDSVVGYHLWYLGAILYVTIIYRWLQSKGCAKALVRISPVLLFCGIVLGKYSKLLLGVDVPVVLSRNWLFVGLPFYTLGAYVRENEKQVKERLSNVALLSLIGIFTLLGMAEKFMLQSLERNVVGDVFLSTPFLAMSCFILAVKHMDAGKNRIAVIGRKYITMIYIAHDSG